MCIVVLPTLVRGCWLYSGSAEALLPAAGAACALRVEPELGDWSCWKLWMDKNDFLRHRQGENEVQLRAGQHSAIPPGHPHNLKEDPKNEDVSVLCKKVWSTTSLRRTWGLIKKPSTKAEGLISN
jgi:hypothetical protein